MTTATATNEKLTAALAYAEKLGWAVLPLHSVNAEGTCTCGNPECDNSIGKHPRTKNGHLEATKDLDQITRWWAKWPDANIGVRTGAESGIVVIDIDPRNDGDNSIEDMEKEIGKLPDTVVQQTGSGGRHLIFNHPGKEVKCSRSELGSGIDVKGDDGYIVVAPSSNANGPYVWELSSNPLDVKIADLPQRLEQKLVENNDHQHQKPAALIPEKIPEGERNGTLVSLAGTMRRRGCEASEILPSLIKMNQRCQPPLDEAEVEKIAVSVSRYAPGENGDPSVSLVSAPGEGTGEIEWPVPQPLPEELPEVKEFEMALLPEAFRPWIEDISERMQCPPDFPAVASMVALGSVVGRQITIRPKREDDWQVVPNLWGAVVARSGLLKSPSMVDPLRPVHKLELDGRNDHDRAVQEYEAQKLIAEAEKKHHQEEIKKAVKQGKDASEHAAAAVAAEDVAPARRRYIVNDTTVEKLGEIMNPNPRGVLLFRDELTGFLKTMDREGHEADRAFYLQAWNGSGRFTYDRIGRGTIDIEAVCVSILGGIQPGPLSQYVRRAARGGADDDGLLQRFQLIVWPNVSKSWKNHDRTPDLMARMKAARVFEELDALDPEGGAVEPLPYQHFNTEAQEEFDQWRADLELRLRSDKEPPLMESHLAKYRSLIPTLALLIHLADSGQGQVGPQALKQAMAWGEYLESHARRVYAAAISPARSAARALADRLLARDLPEKGFALRDVYRNEWSKLADREDVQMAVDLLESLDWLRVSEERTPGRSRTRYLTNPLIFEADEHGKASRPAEA